MQFTQTTDLPVYSEVTWRNFVFFSANVQHLLDVRALATQQKLYHHVCSFAALQAQADMDTFLFRDKTFWLAPPDRPAFILTFHFGHYRAVPIFLVRRGYRLCIPVSKDVRAQQEAYYSAHLGASFREQVLFLEAEDPHLFFKLRRHMDQGYHVLCYLDGGTGASVTADANKLTEIPFLNGSIRVRQGIVDMAWLLQKGIHTLIVEMPDEQNGLTICTLDYCDTKWYGDRKFFVNYYIKSIYQDFEDALLQHPEGWEAWLYLHKTMAPGSHESRWTTEQRMVLFKNQGQQLLLDKYTYLSYVL
ncbi:hypothetical protein D7322_07010 [Sphingobacterium puteale]|uniref:Lipid A biosynthesis acyltransferase n=1 Tax=Sphingobacterium puteale TaxID=2420510 RepID=A0A420W1R2_9SPHI|nr:hypothetical protein [Sphingobacterium puteale]RKO72535.1 hypothetical protein D7322_07010 [Sphingobacterium puteale]